MIKRSIHPKYITIINVCILNNRSLKYVKQKVIELKRKIKKISNFIWKLQYSTFYNWWTNGQQRYRRPEQHYQLTWRNWHLYSMPSNNSRMHILHKYTWNLKIRFLMGHKANLKNGKEIEIMQSMFSGYKGIDLEISHWKVSGTSPNYLEIKQHTSK